MRGCRASRHLNICSPQHALSAPLFIGDSEIRYSDPTAAREWRKEGGKQGERERERDGGRGRAVCVRASHTSSHMATKGTG